MEGESATGDVKNIGQIRSGGGEVSSDGEYAVLSTTPHCKPSTIMV